MSDAREQCAGFVGLGMMGAPMAENILKAGFPLVVYDIDPTKSARFAALGAQITSGPAEVASRARIVVSMVDTTAQAEEVIVGPGGLIDGAQPGDVVISMSTIDPISLTRMHGTLDARGVGIIDAPVSGMEKGARSGTLKAFVGGDVATIEKARSVLNSMTSEIIRFGSIGQGTVMKLVNNMMCQVNWIVASEALVMGAKAGLDPQLMFDTLSTATGNSVALQYLAPRALARDFDGIRLDIVFKDMELQTQLAKSLGVPLPVANIAQQIYQMARAAGLGSEDTVAVLKIYEQMANTSLAGQRTS